MAVVREFQLRGGVQGATGYMSPWEDARMCFFGNRIEFYHYLNACNSGGVLQARQNMGNSRLTIDRYARSGTVLLQPEGVVSLALGSPSVNQC